ncbi:TPA: TatD family deoxyribonuclease [Candidatus Bathyarchaeota archaeon]|nr:TatD family deoxyribonuclease [Candidatus Bathyarchaeota archaeon]
MIDGHCHLEQPDFSRDLHDVVRRCREGGIRALVTSCAHPKDLDLTMRIVERYRGYVFATLAIHPGHVKDVPEEEVSEYVERLRGIGEGARGIGECGLDFKWVTEPEWRDRQRVLFVRFIELAEELGKPLVIHSRGATEEAIRILEEQGAERVLMHFFTQRRSLARVVDNGWLISVNTGLLRSKTIRKIVRDTPIDRIVLETDAPWMSPSGGRNEPTAIRTVAERIARVKGMTFDRVWQECGRNAARFYGLPVGL